MNSKYNDWPPQTTAPTPDEIAEAKRAEEKALYEEGLEIASFDEAQKAAEAARKSQEKESPDEVSDAARLLDEFDKGNVINRGSINLEDYMLPVDDELVEVEQKYSVPGITERPATKEELLVKLEDVLKKAQLLATKVLVDEGEYVILAERYKQKQSVDDSDKDKIQDIQDIQEIYRQISLIKKALDVYLEPDLKLLLERLDDNANFFVVHRLIPDSYLEIAELKI